MREAKGRDPFVRAWQGIARDDEHGTIGLEEWARLMEARGSELVRVASDLTLPNLGSVLEVEGPGTLTAARERHPRHLVSVDLDKQYAEILRSKGICHYWRECDTDEYRSECVNQEMEGQRGAIYLGWVVLESGKWGKLGIVTSPQWRHSRFYKKATTLTLTEFPPLDLVKHLGLNPPAVMQRLTGMVRALANAREQRLRVMLDHVAQMEGHDQVFAGYAPTPCELQEISYRSQRE
jgi:hypothetical protein